MEKISLCAWYANLTGSDSPLCVEIFFLFSDNWWVWNIHWNLFLYYSFSDCLLLFLLIIIIRNNLWFIPRVVISLSPSSYKFWKSNQITIISYFTKLPFWDKMKHDECFDLIKNCSVIKIIFIVSLYIYNLVEGV